jgi:membrane protease YdiL (CAAX protease family)
MNARSSVIRVNSTQPKRIISSILLFLIVFGLWQIYYVIHIFIPEIQVSYTYAFYFAIYLASLAIFIFLVKLRKSTLSEYGFKEPANTNRCLIVSVFSITFYLAVTLLPGFIWGFSSPPYPNTFFYFVFTIVNAIIVSLITESIFRGYIFKNIIDKYGFFASLYASSVMFSLYQIPIPTLTAMSPDRIITYIFTDIIPTFAAGIFLGFFFYKTGWSLLGPIIFRTGILLYLFLPPIMATPPWWMKLTFEVTAYACLIILLEATVKEPKFLRRKYRIES